MRYALVRQSFHHMGLRVAVFWLTQKKDCSVSDPDSKTKRAMHFTALVDVIDDVGLFFLCVDASEFQIVFKVFVYFSDVIHVVKKIHSL